MSTRLSPILLLASLAVGCRGEPDAATVVEGASTPTAPARLGADGPPAAAEEYAALASGAGLSRKQASSPAPSPLGQSFPSGNSIGTELPMLIRRGNASIRVDSLDRGISAVRILAARAGAIVTNTSLGAGERQHTTATLELRVPSARFDELVDGLAPIGKLESMHVQVQDVGEEYTDVAARVANASRLEERLVTLLATRTGQLADVLSVERELARVREEIERYEGRMRFLRTQVAFSTLAISVHEPLPLIAGPPGQHPITRAFHDAWRNFVGVIAALIAATGVLVPVGALMLGVWLAVRRRARRLTV